MGNIKIASVNTGDARRVHNSKVSWTGATSKEVITKTDEKGEVINIQKKPGRETDSGEDQYTKN